MKKILPFLAIIIVMITSLSFVIFGTKNTDLVMRAPIHKTTMIKSTCSCSTPTNIHAVRSGGNVTVTWNTVPGAMSYNVGEYYSCWEGFNFCTTTNSIVFPSPCFVTLRVFTNCDVTNCANSQCYSAPSLPVFSN